MTGLVELCWTLRHVRETRPETTGTLVWDEVMAGRSDIFLWEAFISGKEKAASHAWDAALGVRAFLANLLNPVAASSVTAESPLSVAGAALLWSGLASDTSLLHRPVPVLRPLRKIVVPGAAMVEEQSPRSRSRRRRKKHLIEADAEAQAASDGRATWIGS